MALFEAMYTGPLSQFRRRDVVFTPHVGIGLFVKATDTYDISAAPDAGAFDESRYAKALEEAEAVGIDVRYDVRELDLVEIRDSVIEWARGTRPDVPTNERARMRRKLALGAPASAF